MLCHRAVVLNQAAVALSRNLAERRKPLNLFVHIEEVFVAARLVLLLGDHHTACFVKDQRAILALDLLLAALALQIVFVFDLFNNDGTHHDWHNKIVEIPSIISVRDLAARVKLSPINIIRELMNNGVMASINQQIDFDTAAIVLQGLGFEPHEEKKIEEASSTEDLSGTLWNRLYAKEDPTSSSRARPSSRSWGTSIMARLRCWT